MKSILWCSILVCFFALTIHTTYADTYTYSGDYDVTITPSSDTAASVTIKFPAEKIGSYTATVCVYASKQDSCVGAGALFKKDEKITKDSTDTLSLTKLPSDKQLYLFISDSSGLHTYPFRTTKQAVPTIRIDSEKSDNAVIISGSVDTNLYPDYQTFTASLIYSKDATLANPINGGALTGRPDKDPSTTASQPNGLGTFYWVLTHLDPNTQYYFQVTLRTASNDTSQSPIEYFNSTDGTAIAPGSAAATADLNTRSYALLAPFPGFSVLPDPDLCAQQRAAGENPKFCDLNDVINYFIKLLISITGVVLVLRLMYEGYQYMTTDVPFLKASAKSGFFVALGGLLFALTSYIILNTINPKLVEESVGLQQLSIGVDADTDVNPITQDIGVPNAGRVGVCTSGVTRVVVQKSSFIACSSYAGIPVATNLKNMLTAAYAANITLQGGGFRTSGQQTQLRIQHCNGNTSDPKAPCTPPTATVGHSNHESGLAVDLTCNSGGTIKSQDDICFKWLRTHAAAYGFQNFSKEPWHWSINGK